MTSVLYGAGLNYQIGNPLRTEITKLNNGATELRNLVTAQRAEIDALRQQVAEIGALRQQVAEMAPIRQQVAEIGALRSKLSELEARVTA
jgi:uncharacterized coiled-coil DUF342 family protein